MPLTSSSWKNPSRAYSAYVMPSGRAETSPANSTAIWMPQNTAYTTASAPVNVMATRALARRFSFAGKSLRSVCAASAL